MKGFIKRFAPFFLTFGLGLLVASFFVSVAAPRLNFKRSWKHRDYHRMKHENRMLKEKVRQLESELKEQKFGEIQSIELNVQPPPMPPLPPMPPKAPVAPRNVDPTMPGK